MKRFGPVGLLTWGLLVACLFGAMGPSARAADPPKGLVLYYSFDQAGTDGAVIDKSGANNNGKATGAKWVSYGKQGGGFEFTATNNFIQVPSNDSLNPKQVTVAVWFKAPDSSAIWRRLIDKRSEQGYALGIGGETKGQVTRGKLAFVINGGTLCLSDTIITDNAWHHGAATFDGDNLRLYVDGIPQKQVVAFHGEIASNTDDLTIGMNRSNPTAREKDQSFQGQIDEVMIFNRALSAEEIKAMVLAVDPNAGKPKFTKQQVAFRLRQLELLYDEGLLTDDFYLRKVAECESAAP